MVSGLHIVDVIIITFYLVACLTLAFYKARSIFNIKEYSVLGTSYFHDVALISAIFTTLASVSYIMGVTEKVYSLGLFFALPRLLMPLFLLFSLKVFSADLEKLKSFRTIGDVMERLYGLPARWISNIASVASSVGMTALQAMALGHLIHYFSSLSFTASIIVGIVIVILYSLTGGVKLKAFTDILQFSTFIVALPIACSFLYHDLGGYSEIIAKMPPAQIELSLNKENLLFFISLIMYGLLPESSGTFIQRLSLASDKKQLTKALRIVTIINIPFIMLICALAFLIQLKAPDIPPNTAFAYFIDHYFTTGVKGLFIVGILTILIASADSCLNSASIICAHDIIKRLCPQLTDKQEVLIARVSTVGISLAAVLIALWAKGIVELNWATINFCEPLVLIPLIAGFFKLRTNYVSYVAAAILAACGVGLTVFIRQELGLISFASGMSGGTIGFFGMHYLQRYTGLLEPESLGKAKVEQVITVTSYGSNNLPHWKNIIKPIIFYLTQPKLIVTMIQDQVAKNGTRHYTFSIFVILNYLAPFFVTAISFNFMENVLIPFRMIAILLCLGLIFLEHWPYKFREKYFAFYWYLTILFCLPFMASYTTFVTHTDAFWLLNAVLSVILLSMLVDSLSFMILTSIGIFSAYTCYHSLNLQQEFYVPQHNIYLIAYLYAFLMLIIMVFMRNKEKAESKKATQMEIFSGAIAHEVQTPLAAIHMLAMTFNALAINMKTHVKKLTRSNGDLYQITLDQADYDMLINILPQDLLHTALEGQKVVELLLLLLKHKSIQENKCYPMKEAVKEAVDSYFFTAAQHQRLSLDLSHDFYFCGSKQYIKQIIHNLLNNAFKYAGDNAMIQVWLQGNSIHFKDNGQGISEATLLKLFKPFQGGSERGNGIGLAFCNILASNMGGSMECRSELGAYTEFVITLPPI